MASGIGVLEYVVVETEHASKRLFELSRVCMFALVRKREYIEQLGRGYCAK